MGGLRETAPLLVNDTNTVVPLKAPAIHEKSLMEKFAGYLAIALMVAAWACEGEFSQVLSSHCPSEVKKKYSGHCYSNDFFLTYLTRIGWSFVLLGWFIWKLFILKETPENAVKFNHGHGLGAFSWSYYLKWGMLLGIGIFASTYTWYVSLTQTTFAANAAVYQTSPVFVFIFSVPILGESVTPLKSFAVLVCVAGAVLVSFYGAGSGGTNKAIGYVWEIVSVLLYAIYEVLYKKYCCDKNDPYPVANSQRLFGMFGLVAVVFLWPLFFILDKTNYEEFVFPDPWSLKYACLVAMSDVMFNLFLLLAILLTSPLLASIGSVMVIPVGCIVDYFLWGKELTTNGYIGVALILVGFFAMISAEHLDHQAKKRDSHA